MKLDTFSLLKLLEKGGPIASTFHAFEPRLEQQSMLKDIVEAFNDDKVALIEAGTGCGKSLAYLLPSLIAASQFQERTVISTNTINLQEQLFYKDIPLLLKALNLDLKVVLVKGMGNYVCLRKFNDAFEERLFYTTQEKEELEELSGVVDRLNEGSRTEIPRASNSVWEKINAEYDTCSHKECPHHQTCYFFKARKEAEEAQILIVNHHLLFADIASRADNERQLLPSYQRLIIDEAHNIEEIATDYFASKVSRMGLLKTIGRISAEKAVGKGHGKLPLLKDKIEKTFPKGLPEEMLSLISRLTIDLPALRRDTLTALVDCFEKVQERLIPDGQENEDFKLRLKESIHKSREWQDCLQKVNGLIDSLKRFSLSIHHLDQDISNYDNERLIESTKGVRFEMGALANRLGDAAELLQEFSKPELPLNQVRWIEQTPPQNLSFLDASLDLSKLFADHLFGKHKTVVLCSATLTTHKSFGFIKKRLGLNLTPKPKIERVYDSPFNYEHQSLIICPTDLPPPDSDKYLQTLTASLLESIIASKGSAFCLFTSYSQLIQVFNLLEQPLRKQGFTLFKQGDKPRKVLIEEYKLAKRPVLFGTDSFWEGVDVAGDQLKLVALIKLPFKVPTEPIIQARSELLLSQGQDPFREYSLPQAIVKFKQGFGRLIRTKKDRGCVICFDSRLTSRPYGGQFLKSLPPCGKAFISTQEIKKTIEQFLSQR